MSRDTSDRQNFVKSVLAGDVAVLHFLHTWFLLTHNTPSVAVVGVLITSY